MRDAIWITWEYQVRNRNLAKALNVTLHEILVPETQKLRYIKCCILTLNLLIREKPKKVFHQSPSIILAFIICILRLFFKYQVIIDCHNAGLKPNEGESNFLNQLAEFSLKRANLVIVHNELIKNQLPNSVKQTYVLPDPLPKTQNLKKADNGVQQKVVFICRWSKDEPYNNVLKAADKLKQSHPNLIIYITGKAPIKILETTLPRNVVLTGFVDEAQYKQYLSNADALIALTTRSDSLNCAAYEAIAYEKPTILSDSKTLRNFFSNGFIHTDNSVDGICAAVAELFNEHSHLYSEMQLFKLDYQKQIDKKLSYIQLLINQM